MAKFRREVYIGNESPVAIGDGKCRVLLDTTKFTSGTYYLEITAYNGDSSSRDIALHNSNHTVEATITVPAGTTTYTRFRTSFTPDNNYQEKHFYFSTAPSSLSFHARIIIVQDTSAVLNTQGAPFLGFRNGVGMSTPTVDTWVDGNYWLYTIANWDGTTKTFEAEVVYWTNSTKNSVTIKLQEDDGSFNFSDKVTVVNAGTATVPTRVRVSFIPVGGRNYRFVFRGSATKYETYVWEARIVITQNDPTAITKFEDGYEWGPNFTDTIHGYHDPAEWTITHDHYAEHTGYGSTSNTYQQAKNGSWATLTNSSITGINRIRGSTAITMPTSAKELRPQYATAIPAGCRIVTICVIASTTFEYAGNIIVSLTPGSSFFAAYSYTGAATLELIPNSSYTQLAVFEYSGAISLELILSSTHLAHFVSQGNIGLSLLPSSTTNYYPAIFSYLNERGQFIFNTWGGLTEFGTKKAFYQTVDESGIWDKSGNLPLDKYVGTVVVELQPNSVYQDVPPLLFQYQGEIAVSLTPNSPYAADAPPYQGSVTFTLTPNSSYGYAFYYTGNIAINLLPVSPSFANYPYSGAIPLALLLGSIYGPIFTYAGAILIEELPGATYVEEWTYLGNVLLQMVPNSSYLRDFVYQASVPLEIISTSSYFPIYFYTADVALSLLPASNHFGDYVYYGALLTSLLPASPYFSDYVFVGNQFLNFILQSAFVPQWEVVGEIDLTLFPGADYKHDFYFPGSILIRLLPESTHLAHYLYFGLIQILLSLSNLDAQEPIESFFFDSIESGSMSPAPQGIYPYPVIETKTLPPPTETVIYIETEERVK
jgi:hypothetical protein